MSLMAIILWALYPLSPWKRFYESTRRLLENFLDVLTDPKVMDRLYAHPDNREGIARIEQGLDALVAFTDHLIYQKAREILGLPYTRWMGMRLRPAPRRRARSLKDLFARVEACALRFDDIEQLAERRAEKLARLLSKNPDALLPRAGQGPHLLTYQHANSGGGPACLIAPPFETTAPPVPHHIPLAATPLLASLHRLREEAGARCAPGVLIWCSTPHRAGLRVRAPP